MVTKERNYSDFIRVREKYAPNMTREEINTEPDKWLDFLPHQKYCEFLDALLNSLLKGTKSTWLLGNYGTGKSHAALVTQKLFSDVPERLNRWFKEHRDEFADPTGIRTRLDKCRKEGTLFVYDYNAQGLGPNKEFLVRLEKGVVGALHENGMAVPGGGNTDGIIERLKREGDNFFQALAEIEDKLSYLPNYRSINEVVKNLRSEDLGPAILGEVQQVFQHDGIFLDVTPRSFLSWIQKVREANGLERVVYIFDEFAPFVEANKTQLKILEDVTENPHLEENRFYFIPVTHLSLNSFVGESSETAKRARDRFDFIELQMPDDIAFRLTGHALRVNDELQNEWEKQRNELASYVSVVVSKFSAVNIKRDSFKKILPIHPMAAFLLKYLSEGTRSNQRSIFEYLSGKEFREFIKTGGPTNKTKRFLTVDYLWEYFVVRDDLGVAQEVHRIHREFERIRRREFANTPIDADEIRVLKAVFLFVLISELLPGGHDRIQPTVENIELAFEGSGLLNVTGIINRLAEKRCFSVAKGFITLFATEAGSDDDVEKLKKEYFTQFHKLLSEPLQQELIAHTLNARSGFAGNRFDLRVTGVENTTLGSLQTSTREKYSDGINKDDGSICLWFVTAKDEKEKTSVQGRIEQILTNLRDHRILMFSFGDRTFCENDVKNWSEYVELRAKHTLASEKQHRDVLETACKKIEAEWFDRIKQSGVEVYQYDAESESEPVDGESLLWSGLKDYLISYTQEKLPYMIDPLAGSQMTALGNTGLQSWALAGIKGNPGAFVGPTKQTINRFLADKIEWSDDWHERNPEHTLSVIRNFLDKKIVNSLGRGGEFSLRRVYIELQRAPYGMRNTCITAFCLGFCLKHILNKGYQWTDHKMTQELTAESLAEIIESVVKDDGANKIKNEKTICRLSTAEKAFVKFAPAAFGVAIDAASRVEDALAHIQDRVRNISDRAPLWTLHYAIDQAEDVSAADKNTIAELLSSLSKICAVSSKNKSSEFSSSVQEIGKTLNENQELVQIIARFAKREYFMQAFALYVDAQKPEFRAQAEKVGDATQQYCKAILDKAAAEAGTLWNEADISREIDETFAEYEVVERAQKLLAIDDFLRYDQVVEQLRTRVRSAGLPKETLLEAFPSLQSFVLALFPQTAEQRCSAAVLRDALDQYDDTVQEVFFDAQRKRVLEFLRPKLSQVAIPDDELRKLVDGISGAFSMTPKDYEEKLIRLVDDYEKESAAAILRKVWRDFSGAETPDDWASLNRIPARYLFEDGSSADELFKALERPEHYTKEVLNEWIESLINIGRDPLSACQVRFMKRVVPAQYAGFEIEIGALTKWLVRKYGEQPNRWPVNPEVSGFVNEEYRYSFAPRIVEKVRKMDAEELKSKIVKLVEENQDVGMHFMEK
jgi:hypothetical protein